MQWVERHVHGVRFVHLSLSSENWPKRVKQSETKQLVKQMWLVYENTKRDNVFRCNVSVRVLSLTVCNVVCLCVC